MPLQIKAVVFILASSGIIWLSWSSLRNPRSHGFPRFFAFESILALILLRIDCWFCEPFSLHQLFSWVLLTVSGLLVVHGAFLLHKVGKPTIEREEPALIGIEKTTRLVTVGAYRYIRHPIYSAGLFLAWGVFFKEPTLLAASLSVLASVSLTLTAKREEGENIKYFGAAYEDYMAQTKMFIPYLF